MERFIKWMAVELIRLRVAVTAFHPAREVRNGRRYLCTIQTAHSKRSDGVTAKVKTKHDIFRHSAIPRKE